MMSITLYIFCMVYITVICVFAYFLFMSCTSMTVGVLLYVAISRSRSRQRLDTAVESTFYLLHLLNHLPIVLNLFSSLLILLSHSRINRTPHKRYFKVIPADAFEAPSEPQTVMSRRVVPRGRHDGRSRELKYMSTVRLSDSKFEK